MTLFTTVEELTRFAADHIASQIREQSEVLVSQLIAINRQTYLLKERLAELEDQRIKLLEKSMKEAQHIRDVAYARKRKEEEELRIKRGQADAAVTEYAAILWQAMIDKMPEPLPDKVPEHFSLDGFRQRARSLAIMRFNAEMHSADPED